MLLEDINFPDLTGSSLRRTGNALILGLVLAKQEFDRAERLLATKVVSQEEYDERRAALDVSNGQVAQALENVYQARVALGLPAQPPAGTSLGDVAGRS